MSLFRQVGANLLLGSPLSYKEQRDQQLRVKREKQLEYMRELDQQVKERAEKSQSRSKSKSKKRLKNNSAIGYQHYRDEPTEDKYSKSALLEQLLSVDYETFKRGRPDKTRSRSNKKYHLLEEINNEGQYKPIPEYKTVFVDEHGREISHSHQSQVLLEQRDDKNYISVEGNGTLRSEQNREPEESQEVDKTERSVEEEHSVVQSKRNSTLSPQEQKQPIPSPKLSKSTVLDKTEQTKKLSSLLIAQQSFHPSHSDRVTKLVSQNRHRFPKLLDAIAKPQLQSELTELKALIETIVEQPRRRMKTTTPKPVEDELVQIKDILTEIASMSKPPPDRRNRFVDKQVLLHQKINERLGTNKKPQKNYGATLNGSLEDLLDSYPTTLPK